MLRRVWTAAMTIAMVLVLASCSDDDEDAAGGQRSDAVSAPKAASELDELTWWVGYRAPYTLDPIQYDDYPEDQIKSNLCEPLVRVAPDFTLKPYIARTIRNPVPTRWVYDIDPEARFWDGSPVTAADVVFSLKRNTAPGSKSFYTPPFANVESIAQTGKRQVTVTLTRPDLTFNNWMATGAAMIVKKSFTQSAGDTFGTPSGDLMCTGPYKLASWNGNDSIEIAANENYWNEDLKPLTDSITFVFPSDTSTVARGFESGEFDGGFMLPSGTLPALRQATSGSLNVGTAEQTLMTDNLAVLNLDNGPTGDPEIRRALWMAIDREGIVDAIYQGAATPLHTVATPGFWSYSTDRFKAAYEDLDPGRDLDEAKKLVADAGDVAKEPIEIAVNSGSEERERMAAILQQNAEEIGLTLEIRQLPPEQYGELFFNPQARDGIDLVMTTSYQAVAEPVTMYRGMATADGAINYGGYRNPRVTKLLNQAGGEVDDDRRADLVIEAQKTITEDLPWIPVTAPSVTTFLKDGIAGAPYTFTMLNSPWAVSVGGR